MLKSMNFLSGKSRGIFKTSPLEGEVGASLRVRGITNTTTNAKSAPLAPVILGLVHRIFWQQISNQVNKFALLLNKYWLREDSWDKPKNDGCWRHGFNSFYAFFKYPSPEAYASPSPSWGEESRLLSCTRNDGAGNGEGLHRPGCDKILGTDCASRPRMTGGRGANYFGRSMIEMLGVLAIIGVLSVGGIAGYSKAMEKWKVTKAIDEYSHLTFGLLEHLDDIKRNSTGGEQMDNITELAQSLNLIPNSWTRLNNSQFEDAYGNTVQLYVRDDKQLLIFDIFIGGIKTSIDGNLNSPDFSSKLCMDIFQNLVVPLHSAVEFSGVWRSVQGIKSFVGDKYCTKEMKNAGSKCLAEASLADFQEACSSCGKSNEICDVSYNF